MKKLAKQQVFKDPLYGFIHVDYELIRKLIDSSLFQRLRRVRQLSGVQMVFHGAEHSRFSHSLGVYEIANRFLTVPDIQNALNEREKLVFLSAALLHDIGHGAYSHAFEYDFFISFIFSWFSSVSFKYPQILRFKKSLASDFNIESSDLIKLEIKPLI